MTYQFPFRLALISSQTASSSASIAFTSGISANFDTYYIKIRRLVPATNATNILMTFSTDGGSTYLSTNYKYAYGINNNAQSVSGSSSASSILLGTSLSSTTANDFNCDIMLYNLNTTNVVTCMFHTSFYSSVPVITSYNGGGMNTGTTAVNAIKFAMSSGNITSGVLSLYGVREGEFLY